jgi:hypothetical protein
VFQNYLASCLGMQELSGVSEAARELAMSRFRLIQRFSRIWKKPVSDPATLILVDEADRL